MKRRPLVLPDVMPVDISYQQLTKLARVPRSHQPMTVLRLKNLNRKGVYSDGSTIGLYVRVTSNGRKAFVYRYMMDGRRHEVSIGPADIISLGEAREQALAYKKQKHGGTDPLTAKREAAASRKAAVTTFQTVMDMYIASHRAAWSNQERMANEFRNQVSKWAKPLLAMPVVTVDTTAIMKVLRPMWSSETKTASRLRIKIEAVLGYAQSHGLRDALAPNPARWAGHLSNLLPKADAVTDKVHHAALAYTEIGAFMAKLRAQQGIPSRALEFVILTATRSGEARLASWDEIDFANKLWTIPKERMKAGREHVVPLTPQMIALLTEQQKVRRRDNLVFPSRTMGAKMGDMALRLQLKTLGYDNLTVHGFRSTARDYWGDATDFPRELAEAALGHAAGDSTEQAYRRGTAVEKRRKIMESWNDYCDRIVRRPLAVGIS